MPRVLIHAAVGLATASLLLALGTARADTTIGLHRRARVATAELTWMHYQVLLHHADLQLLLKYLNEDNKWRFGPVVPKGYRWVDSKSALDRIMLANSNQGRGWNALIGVWDNRIYQGNRENTVYAFAVAPTRNAGKPYSAAILVGRDLNSGNYWVRALVREFENADPLNIHEYAVRNGAVVRLSSKKGEPLMRNAMITASGNTKDAFKNITMPRMQKASDMLSQCEAFIGTDPNAATDQTATSAQLASTQSKEPWWKSIVSKALDKLRSLFEKGLNELWDAALAWFKKFWPSILKTILSWF